MFKALKAIFATPATASKVADAVIKGTDAAWFTKEEQSEWFLRYLESTQPMNLSRRIIAIAISGLWVCSSLLLLSLVMLGAIFESPVIGFAGEAVYEFMNNVVNTPFMLIIGFYFAKGIAGSFAKKAK